MLRSFRYGGQAVLEGVMMRGSRSAAVAVRKPSGEIVVHTEPLTSPIYNSVLAKIPVVRGLAMLWDSLVLGIRALMFSADVALSEEEGVEFSGPIAWGSLILGLVIGVGIFVATPPFLVGIVDRYISSPMLSNLLEGIIRIALFIVYITLVGKMPDIDRVFAHHGAEHKTINAYEDGVALEPSVVARYSCAHVRCGTGFLLIVLIIFIALATLFGRPPLLLRILSRIVLIPLVGGISYELTKLGANYRDNPIVRVLLAPGLALQRLTTREPDESMIEVAITALKAVLASERDGELAAE